VLALACDEIVLQDDGFSAVSLPEVPLLGVLPGTGGLTRLVDKRRVRPDLIDRFATMAEGVRGKRALEWRLVDHLAPRSRFDDVITERIGAARHRERAETPTGGITLDPLDPDVTDSSVTYRYVDVLLDPMGRSAALTVSGPGMGESALYRTADWWPLRMARELDDALLRLRFNAPEIGLLVVRTRGNLEAAAALGNQLAASDEWFTRETLLLLSRTLRRLDLTARSVFAAVDEGSCFAGPLFELLLAADRTYVLDSADIEVWPGPLSAGLVPRWNGHSRLAARYLGQPGVAEEILALGRQGSIDTMQLEELGLATELWDDLDFDEGLRLAIEERVSLSPDALTGMEASTRFAGPENMATRIFGRLSAWQNWVFRGANATGETGALALYGKPERPRFDFTRT
jgi:benzoyl-CoA-dihydrodiol lyase